MHGVGAAQTGGRDLRETYSERLSLVDESRKRFGHLLDRDVRITPMHIEKINRFQTHPDKAPVQFRLQMRRRVVKGAGAVRATGDRRLGRDTEPPARVRTRFEIASYRALGTAHSVNVCGVDMVDPGRQGRVKDRVAVRLRGGPVEIGETHGTDTDGMDHRPVLP